MSQGAMSRRERSQMSSTDSSEAGYIRILSSFTESRKAYFVLRIKWLKLQNITIQVQHHIATRWNCHSLPWWQQHQRLRHLVTSHIISRVRPNSSNQVSCTFNQNFKINDVTCYFPPKTKESPNQLLAIHCKTSQPPQALSYLANPFILRQNRKSSSSLC